MDRPFQPSGVYGASRPGAWSAVGGSSRQLPSLSPLGSYGTKLPNWQTMADDLAKAEQVSQRYLNPSISGYRGQWGNEPDFFQRQMIEASAWGTPTWARTPDQEAAGTSQDQSQSQGQPPPPTGWGVSRIWGGTDIPVSQQFGETASSKSNPAMYEYAKQYGASGHPGVDYAMSYGTKLFTPVDAVVQEVGTGYYTDGTGGVGEVRLKLENGDEIIFGHMSSTTLRKGQTVRAGDLLGASGTAGTKGTDDNLHLEVRKFDGYDANNQPIWRIVDPRLYFSG